MRPRVGGMSDVAEPRWQHAGRAPCAAARPAPRASPAPWSWASSTSRRTRSPTAGSGSSRRPPSPMAWRCATQGADLVDVGGESTRPGAERPSRRGGAAPGHPGRARARGRGRRGQCRHHAGRPWREAALDAGRCPGQRRQRRPGRPGPAACRRGRRRALCRDALARAQHPDGALRGVRRRRRRRRPRSSPPGWKPLWRREFRSTGWCSTPASASPRTAPHNWACAARAGPADGPRPAGAGRGLAQAVPRRAAGRPGRRARADRTSATTRRTRPARSPLRPACGACGCTTCRARSTRCGWPPPGARPGEPR